MLAVSQSLGSNPMTTLDMPAALSTRVLNALKADPRTVDLRTQAPHFYNLGTRMMDLFEEDEIVEVLTNVSALPGPGRPERVLHELRPLHH